MTPLNCSPRVVLVTLLLSSPLLAKEDGWSGSSSVGVTIATGNSESLRATAGLEATGRFDTWEVIGKASGIYGEDDTVRSHEQFAALLQLNRDFTEKIYAGLASEFLYDAVADIDYRLGVAPLLGIRVLDDERMTLRFEAGPGYIVERRNGSDRDYVSFRLHEAFTYQLSDDTRFFQALTVEAEAEDLANYLLTAEAGVESRLVGQWSLRVAGKATHYGEAQRTSDSDDFLLTAGFGYNFVAQDHQASSLADAHAERTAVSGEWAVTALLGGSLARGNTESYSLNAGLQAKRVRSNDELGAGVFGSYGETNSLVSTEAISADAYYQHSFSEVWFVGARLDADHDALADLDWRLAFSPYLGRKLITTETTKLTAEAGPSLVIEHQGGADETYLAVYAALKGEQKIGDSTRLYGEVAWLAEAGDLSSYLLSSEAGLDQSLTEKISLKLIARSQYDSTPASGRQEHDLQLITALGVEF